MTEGATYAGVAFGALGDPTRRAVLECVAERPRAVGELADLLPVTRPAVSQHLKVLKDAGLVTDRRDGNRRIYQVDPTGIEQLRAYLDRFWGAALGAFKAAAERPPSATSATRLPARAAASPAEPRNGQRREKKRQQKKKEQGERSRR